MHMNFAQLDYDIITATTHIGVVSQGDTLAVSISPKQAQSIRAH